MFAAGSAALSMHVAAANADLARRSSSKSSAAMLALNYRTGSGSDLAVSPRANQGLDMPLPGPSKINLTKREIDSTESARSLPLPVL